MITFHGVTKDYDGHIALNHLDLTIEDGQIVGYSRSQRFWKVYSPAPAHG